MINYFHELFAMITVLRKNMQGFSTSGEFNLSDFEIVHDRGNFADSGNIANGLKL